MKHFNRTVTVLVFIFLYIPMIVLGIASFNAGTDIATFKGFTLSQYANLFRDSALLRLLLNSLIIAVLSTLAATVFGTMAAVGIHGMNGKLRSAVMTLTNIPMTNPDIVTGVALALLFAFTGAMLRINSILGFWTLLIAHITFNLPYVILNSCRSSSKWTRIWSRPRWISAARRRRHSQRSSSTRSCPASSPAH